MKNDWGRLCNSREQECRKFIENCCLGNYGSCPLTWQCGVNQAWTVQSFTAAVNMYYPHTTAYCSVQKQNVSFYFLQYLLIRTRSQHENDSMYSEFQKNIFWTLTDYEVPSRKIWNCCLNSSTYMKYLLWKGNTKVFFNKVNRWYFVQKVTFCPLNTTETINLQCKCY